MRLKFPLLCLVCISVSHGQFTVKDYSLVPPIFHLDDYERCLHSQKNGLYCSVAIELEALDRANTSATFHAIQKLSSDPRNFKYDLIRHGICVRSTCPEIDLAESKRNDTEFLKTSISECYNEKYYTDLGLRGSVIKIQCDEGEPLHKIGIYDILVGLSLAALILLVLFGSIYDSLVLSTSEKDKNGINLSKVERYLQCFSIPRNWKTLKGSNKNYATDRLGCFNGTRCYAMYLELLMHTGVFLIMGPSVNPHFLAESLVNPITLVFFNSFLIQIFFIMSSWLLAYNTFKTFEKNGEINYFDFVIRKVRSRYFRLAPVMMVAMAFSGTWLYYFPRGANWEKLVGTEYSNCRYNGWLNVLFLNNYIDSGNMCLLQTWYVAVDFQLYILSLVFLVFLWKYKEYAKTIFIVSLMVPMTISTMVNYAYDYGLFIIGRPETLHKLSGEPHSQTIYCSTYSNMGCYAIGLVFGYAFYKTENKKFFTKKTHYIVWLMLASLPFTLGLLQFYHVANLKPFSRFSNAMLYTIFRHLYPFGIATLLFGFSHGLGGLLLRFMTWSPFQVLGKLMYSVYIVHFQMMRVWVGQLGSATYVTQFFWAATSTGLAMLSLIVAVILYLMVELPFCALHDLMFSQKRERQVSKKVE